MPASIRVNRKSFHPINRIAELLPWHLQPTHDRPLTATGAPTNLVLQP